jgi:hypothetical protein
MAILRLSSAHDTRKSTRRRGGLLLAGLLLGGCVQIHPTVAPAPAGLPSAYEKSDGHSRVHCWSRRTTLDTCRWEL